jgi:amidase
MADAGRGVSAAQWVLAGDDLHAYSRRAAHYFDDFALFLSPTVTTPPPTLEAMKANPGEMIRNAGVIANVTGNPAMSVPLFWNGDGLPIGSHFLAPFGDEATLLRLASQLEAAQPWADKWPGVSVGA